MINSKKRVFIRFSIGLFAIFLFQFGVVKQVQAADADTWKLLGKVHKAAFVAGLRSGYTAAQDRAKTSYEAIKSATDNMKYLPDNCKELSLAAARNVWTDTSNVAIFLLLDENFVEDFIKYLDYYFTDPNNKYAHEALPLFLADRLKRKR
jgi:hypothetical protein